MCIWFSLFSRKKYLNNQMKKFIVLGCTRTPHIINLVLLDIACLQKPDPVDALHHKDVSQGMNIHSLHLSSAPKRVGVGVAILRPPVRSVMHKGTRGKAWLAGSERLPPPVGMHVCTIEITTR